MEVGVSLFDESNKSFKRILISHFSQSAIKPDFPNRIFETGVFGPYPVFPLSWIPSRLYPRQSLTTFRTGFHNMCYRFVIAVLFLFGVDPSIAMAQDVFAPNPYSNMGVDLFSDHGLRTFDADEGNGIFQRDSTYIYQKRPNSEMWVPSGRNIYAYSASGNNIRTETSRRLSKGGWEPESQTIYNYGANSELSSKEYEIWDMDTGDYVNDTRENYSFDNRDLIEYITTENWNDTAWIAVNLRFFEFNSARVLTSETTYENDEEISGLYWSPLSRMLYTYNDYADIHSEVLQAWDEAAENWVNRFSELYVYDASNRLIETVLRTWSTSTGSWREVSASIVEYDTNGQLTGTEQYTATTGSISGINFHVISFDQTGNPGSTTTSVWRENAWVVVEKQIHYWSKTALGNFPETSIRCYYSNPYPARGIWRCEGLKTEVPYVLDIYDLQGRHRHVQSIPSDGLFRVDSDLDSGFYTVVIRGGLDLHTEKVYISP